MVASVFVFVRFDIIVDIRATLLGEKKGKCSIEHSLHNSLDVIYVKAYPFSVVSFFDSKIRA